MHRTTIFWLAIFLMSALSVDTATGMWISLFKFGEIPSAPMQRLKWLAPIGVASLLCFAGADWRCISKNFMRNLFLVGSVVSGMIVLDFFGGVALGFWANGFLSFFLLLLAMAALHKKTAQDVYFATGLFLFLIGPVLVFL